MQKKENKETKLGKATEENECGKKYIKKTSSGKEESVSMERDEKTNGREAKKDTEGEQVREEEERRKWRS